MNKNFKLILRVGTIIMFLFYCHIYSLAALPFKDSQEFINFVKNLDIDKVTTSKAIGDYMVLMGEMPIDPIKLKGIELFNKGKYEQSVEYFKKIKSDTKCCTREQRTYAQYQLYHIGQFGIVDPYFNGRPSTIDRSGGIYLANDDIEYPLLEPEVIVSKFILECNPQLPTFNPLIWEQVTKNKFDFQSFAMAIPDMDMLYALIKASYPESRRGAIAHFPSAQLFKDEAEFYKYVSTDYLQKEKTPKDVREFLAPKGKLPIFPELRKGIDMDLAGKHKQALAYFEKLKAKKSKHKELSFSDYANYQCWHILNFGAVDPYYDGRPSDIERTMLKNWIDEYVYNGKRWYSLKDETRLLIYTLMKSDSEWYYYAFNNWSLDLWLKKSSYINSKKLNNYDFLDLMLDTLFPINETPTAVNNYIISEADMISKLIWKDKYTIDNFNNKLKILPLLSRTHIDIDNKIGIGLSANELYEQALKRISSLPTELKLDKAYDNKTIMLDIKTKIYLLRSALWGNTDAMNKYILIYAFNINSKTYKPNHEWSEELFNFIEDLKNQKSLNQHSKLISGYYDWFKEVYMAHKKAYAEQLAYERKQEELRREQKRQRREQLWANIAGAVVQGMAQGLNAYAQAQGYSAPMPVVGAVPSMPSVSSASSVSSMMSDPYYFQNVKNTILQQSYNKVMMDEYNEYLQAREGAQHMGRDLSLDEFRTLKGAAIQDLKNEGYDIVAEQKKIANEYRNFERELRKQESKDRINEIKRLNEMKYGSSGTSTTTALSSTTTSTATTTSSSKPKTTVITDNSLKVVKPAKPENKRATNTTKKPETITSEYTYKKRVTLYRQDGSNFKVFRQNVELYEKGAGEYIKLDGTYFRATQPQKVTNFKHRIIYGHTGLFYN